MKRRDFTRSFGRAYDGPRMRNPFFAAPTPGKTARYLVVGIIIAAIIGIPLVFIYAPFMRYDATTLSGLTTLDSAQVAAVAEEALGKRRLLVIPGRHLFFARKDRIAEALDAQFHFDSLSVLREGRTLRIEAKERITEIAWTVGDKTYFVDLSGVAVRDATTEALAMIASRRAGGTEIPRASGVQPTTPIIDIVDGTDATLGTVVIAADRLAHILAIDAGMRARGVSPLVYTLTENDAAWLTLTTNSGPSILLDITAAPEEAFTMYDALVRDRNGDVENVLYIDLRFGNHVYIKQK